MNQTAYQTGKRCCFVIGSIALLLGNSVFVRGQHYRDFTTRTPLQEDRVLILGFLGGRESWDNPRLNVRKLALKLRAEWAAQVQVETLENMKRPLALELIRRAFDRNEDGALDAEERARVKLILYGQSFGGAAVVKLARQLQQMHVPVLLTVQVDSVGRDDELIPANVARAANLFQRNGRLIRGEPEIRAEAPLRTTILGNFEFDYRAKKVDLSEVPWLKKAFSTAHAQMDFDPAVWGKVEELIVNEIKKMGGES